MEFWQVIVQFNATNHAAKGNETGGTGGTGDGDSIVQVRASKVNAESPQGVPDPHTQGSPNEPGET